MTTPKNLSEWLEYIASIHVSAIDMGLERVLPVAKKLRVLKEDLVNKGKTPYIFTVAGTNGKGSTTATIAKICQTAGYKTALYQSPHLISFNERIRINSDMIDDEKLIWAFSQVEQARLECQFSLSFFEMTTLAAFCIFKHANCDVWVLEVGLGGRLDVVNIIDPDMCVITNIGIDHTDWLGDTREKIGFEKAGILRPNSTLIFGEADMPNSIKTAIDNKHVTCYQLSKDYSHTDMEEYWVYSTASMTLKLPTPSLSLVNVSTAISAVLASPLAVHHALDSIHTITLAGRFDKRYLNHRHFVFDVGHNGHGIQFLLQHFVPYWQAFCQTHPKATLHAVFSMLADKDIDQVLKLIASSTLAIDSWHIGKIDNPRATDTHTLLDKLTQHLTHPNIYCYPTLHQAIVGVLEHSNDGDMVVCFGSFHTIAESLIALGEATNPKTG